MSAKTKIKEIWTFLKYATVCLSFVHALMHLIHYRQRVNNVCCYLGPIETHR